MKKVKFILDGLRKGSVLAIGVFDGVHLGHQLLLQKAKELAEKEKTILAVLTFSPHPEEILRGEKGFLILSEEERKNKLLEFGADVVIMQEIDSFFLSLKPAEFVEELASFSPSWVVIGEDFHFGQGKKGDSALMFELGEKYSFKVLSVPLYEVNGEKISSSLIRQFLAKGDLKSAAAFLGFPYYLVNRSERRKGLASKILGCPTVNLSIDDRLFGLPSGVYLAQATFQNEQREALVYYGTSPTLGLNQKALEVHFLDFKGEIPEGSKVKVEFLEKLREEVRFSNLEELKEQVKKDLGEARRWFSRTKTR